MIPKGLFTQIAMLILSIAIVITYIKPTFEQITQVQTETKSYTEKIGSVSGVNIKLTELVSRLESVSQNDWRRLSIYMPDEVDPINITRDLLIISDEAGVIYRDAFYIDPSESIVPIVSDEDADKSFVPISHTVGLAVEGTYDQIKKLFSLLEQNHYPLEIVAFDIAKLNGGFLSATISLRTYSYRQPDVDNKKVF